MLGVSRVGSLSFIRGRLLWCGLFSCNWVDLTMCTKAEENSKRSGLMLIFNVVLVWMPLPRLFNIGAFCSGVYKASPFLSGLSREGVGWEAVLGHYRPRGRCAHGAEIQPTSCRSQHARGTWKARPPFWRCALQGWNSWLFNYKSTVHGKKLNYRIWCALGFSAEAAALLSWMLRGRYLK